MTEINESILDRARALLHMAEHPNSNPNEASLALQRLQSLLLKHNLDMAQIKDDKQIEPEHLNKVGVIDRTEANGFSWKSILMNQIAVNNLCRVVVTSCKNQIHVFGTYDNVKTVLEMFDWIVIQLIPMAIKARKDYVEQGGTEHGRTFNTGFYNGAVHTISERLSAGFKEFKQTTGRELVVYNDKALQLSVSKIYPRLSHSYGRSIRSSEGIIAGKIAGSNIQFGQSRKIGSRLSLNAGF